MIQPMVLEDWIYLYYLNFLKVKILLTQFLRIEFICIIWTSFSSFRIHKAFLRIEFICIIWTQSTEKMLSGMFLRIEFICIIWTENENNPSQILFLRIEFICIIWTLLIFTVCIHCSWGLNLFVLFELALVVKCFTAGSWGLNLFVLFELLRFLSCFPPSSWGLNLFVLFERGTVTFSNEQVLEDWIYLYYLNVETLKLQNILFLRIEFICIIWTFSPWVMST